MEALRVVRRHTAWQDQDLLLAAVDRFVPPKEVARCRGPAGDGLVSLECLAEALKGTAPNKAPGSDGLTYEVYKAFGWDVLQQPLTDCFNEAFQGLGLPPELAQEVRLTESQRQGIIVVLLPTRAGISRWTMQLLTAPSLLCSTQT